MKNLFLFMAITLVGLGGCSEKRSQPLAIDNSLTQEEIAAGVLSPEVMWKMGRVGLASLSPDDYKGWTQGLRYSVLPHGFPERWRS